MAGYISISLRYLTQLPWIVLYPRDPSVASKIFPRKGGKKGKKKRSFSELELVLVDSRVYEQNYFSNGSPCIEILVSG